MSRSAPVEVMPRSTHVEEAPRSTRVEATRLRGASLSGGDRGGRRRRDEMRGLVLRRRGARGLRLRPAHAPGARGAPLALRALRERQALERAGATGARAAGGP